MKRSVQFMLVLCCTLALYSCKQEGCTDPDALNYNIVADDDDGSCQYCSDDAINILGYSDFILVDQRGWSPYSNQPVVRIETNQKNVNYAYTDCGQSACYLEMNVQNIIEEDISFLEYNMNFQTVDGFSYNITQWQSINLAVGQDTTITVAVSFAPQQCSAIIGGTNVFGSINSAEYN